MKILPNVEETNNKNYLEIVRKLDPELFMIKTALEETKLDPLIITHIIRQLGNLLLGNGWGKIQVFMQAKVITQIKGEESVELNRRAEKEE